MSGTSAYNQKLFSGGIRSYFHHLRFEWLRRQIRDGHEEFSLFELGCFDCRSLAFLPKPARYAGADAGWENGLMDAQKRYANADWVTLVRAESANDLAVLSDQRFDYSISLETLEHVPPELLEEYIRFLARVTTSRLYVSVPVEIGPVFLFKFLAKKFIKGWESGDTETYRLAEVFWATLGDVDKVERFQHKGFDYRRLVALIGKYFTVSKVEGIPFSLFPLLSFQVGIVAEPKKKAAE